jgi:uncharacterized transporter YbjL
MNKIDEEEEFLIKNKDKIDKHIQELKTPEYVALLNRINKKNEDYAKESLDKSKRNTHARNKEI